MQRKSKKINRQSLTVVRKLSIYFFNRIGLKKHKIIAASSQPNKKYYIGEQYPNIYFTHQEARYVYYVVKGFKNKEICKIMKITPRTCFWHCGNIKTKIKNVRNKKELAEKIKETEFMSYMDYLATQEKIKE